MVVVPEYRAVTGVAWAGARPDPGHAARAPRRPGRSVDGDRGGGAGSGVHARTGAHPGPPRRAGPRRRCFRRTPPGPGGPRRPRRGRPRRLRRRGLRRPRGLRRRGRCAVLGARPHRWPDRSDVGRSGRGDGAAFRARVRADTHRPALPRPARGSPPPRPPARHRRTTPVAHAAGRGVRRGHAAVAAERRRPAHPAARRAADRRPRRRTGVARAGRSSHRGAGHARCAVVGERPRVDREHHQGRDRAARARAPSPRAGRTGADVRLHAGRQRRLLAVPGPRRVLARRPG